MKEKITRIMEGSMAVAEAVAACKPDVISAYPISPQTHIVEDLSSFVASGRLKSIFIRADSEFSAASIIYGASAAGARAYTASSSQGLLLMTEVVFVLATTRLPVVITAVNRTVSAPISIQPDHQDSMTLRDPGIIQIHVESIQEAYDAHIQAFKIAEDPDILLPVMICMDGWILSHSYEPVTLFDEKSIQEFVGDFKPVQYLDPNNPLTYGAYADEDRLTEFKYALMMAQENAKSKIEKVARDYEKLFGHYAGGLLDTYCADDADILIVAMGSLVSTIRVAVDEMRAEGKRVGLIKVRSFRPFPAEALIEASENAQVLAVLDKSISINIGGILASEIKAAFYQRKKRPYVLSFLAGIGGKEINRQVLRHIYAQSTKVIERAEPPRDPIYVGINYDAVQALKGGYHGAK